MSTEKTPNLLMHRWAPQDGVRREEWNDNFLNIDGKIGDSSNLPSWLLASLYAVGKMHDDQLRQSAINIMMSPYNANPNNDAATNTAAIQSAINTGKHVLIPDGIFLINFLTVNTQNQHLIFNSEAKLSSGYAGDVITLVGNYAQVDNGYILCTGTSVVNGIRTKGQFNCLNNCTVTGISQNALYVDEIETRVHLGKYKGGTTAGIHVSAPDLYLSNVYVEQNRDGLYANGIGSITAHHVHAYGNTRHGFYLSGASYSQLHGCYADTNGANGFEIRDTSAGFTLVDCWGYKSSNITANQNDFLFSNAKNMKLIGCRSSGSSAQPKLASFKFDSTSQVDLIGCHADRDPDVNTSLIKFTNCGGSLQRYNRSTDVSQSFASSIEAASSLPISVVMLVPDLWSTPGILGFEVTTLWRREDDNSAAGIERQMILLGTGVVIATQVTPVTPTSPKITITSPTFTADANGNYNLSFIATNTLTGLTQVSFNVRYLGTGRGYI